MMGHKEAAQSIQSINGLAREYWKRPADLTSYLKDRPHSTISKPKLVKNVGFFFHDLGIGGGERVTCRLAEILKSAGYSTTIITNNPLPKEKGQDLPDGVSHIQVPSYTDIDGQTYATRSKALVDTIELMDLDAIVFCQWFSDALPFDLMTTRACGALAYLYIQSSFSLFFLDADMPSSYAELPITYSLADRIISLSESDRMVWSAFNANSVATYNPPSEPMPKKTAPLNGHHIIWPARLHVDKCPERVIPIMDNLVKLVPDAVIHMVGPVEDEYKKHLEQIIIAHHLKDNVLIEGPRASDEMQALYLQADAYLLTSKREGWSLALAEAMAAGLPCVIYDLPYLTLVQKNPAIDRIPQDDSQQAATKLAHILLDKEYARKKVAVGRRVIEEIYSFDTVGFWRSCFEQDCRGTETPTLSESRNIIWTELVRSYAQHLRSIESTQSELIRQLRDALTTVHERNIAVAQVNNEACELRHSLQAMEKSLSYRIGRAITFIPRKIKRLIGR